MSSLEVTQLKETSDINNDDVDYDEILPWTVDLIKGELPDNFSILPKEINKFLRDRIRDLIAENGRLRQALNQYEEKLHNHYKKFTKNSTTTYQKRSSELASNKIVELSKKCRELTAEVETLKTKCKNLESNLASKEQELQNIKSQKENSISVESMAKLPNNENHQLPPKDEEDQIKSLTEKLQYARTKLHESRNMCNILKQEVNKAQKLLCSEVGENVTISGLSSQPGGWRGRAAQIHLLQQKVSELQIKLSEFDCSRKSSAVSLERKNLAIFRNIEKERRERIENTAKELRQTELALETNKKKLEASKARIRVLENELNAAKASIAVLNEKRTHDDHLIEILNSRLKAIEMKNQEREMDIKNKESKIERECINLRNDLQSAHIQIEQLRKKLEEREIEIDKLRHDTAAIPSHRGMSLEYKANMTFNISPPMTTRNFDNPSEYVILALAAENERERLLELVTVLNRRIDTERNEVDSLQEALRNERNKCAKLESRLKKLETERVGLAKVDSGYKKFYNKHLTMANDQTEMSEKNRFQLELLQEECLALKARLETVQKDKAADLAMYKQMLEQTKKTFQDACRSKPSLLSDSNSLITIFSNE